MTTQDFGARAVIARFSAPVLRPTRDSVRGLALASVIANAVLVCAGAAVRLSSSGLGCPDWPPANASPCRLLPPPGRAQRPQQGIRKLPA